MRNFKRSIILVLTLVLCIGAVVSGTIAWFTDVTETRGSTVKASVLKAGLYKDQITAANRVSETSPALFTVPERWEPGAVSYANLFIKNEGNVALWYELSLRVDDFNTIVGTDYSLLDVLKVAVVPKEIPANATRAEVFSWAEASPSCSLDQLLTTGILYPANDTNTSNSQTVHPRSLVLYWPSTYGNDVDNRYNLNKGQEVNKPLVNNDGTKTNELYADVSVVLVATQAPVEFDSFNNGDYDAGA